MDRELERVCVTGMGCINSVANSVCEFEEALREGRQGIGFLQKKEHIDSIKVGAEIKDFSMEQILDKVKNDARVPKEFIGRVKKIVRRAPYAIQVAWATVLEAYIQADLLQSAVESDRIGIVVAGNNLTNEVKSSYLEKCKQDLSYMAPSYAIQFMDTDHVGTLSELFHITGEGFVAGGASASGNVGIIKGYEMLQLGLADVCVVVGAVADLSDAELMGFQNIGALGPKKLADAPEKACRPFDTEHEGFIYGQGCGCLILETEESAKRRGASVLAEIAGGAIVLDGNRLSNPSVSGETKVMEKALKRSHMKPEEIEYINTHGTSSPLGDETELQAIKNVWKENCNQVFLNSTKSLIGHCLFSAGVVEAIATIIQMNRAFLHVSRNLEHPIQEDFRFVRDASLEHRITAAISNSFGFGGINTSVVIKNYQDSILKK